MNLKGTMKGQMSFINFCALLVVEFMFLAILPVILSISQATVIGIQTGPQTEFTPWLVTIIQMLPFAIQFMIIVTGFWIAIPRQQGG